MSLTEAIHPDCTPWLSISGEMYTRTSTRSPVLRWIRSSKPEVGARPDSVSSRFLIQVSSSSAGQ